MIKGEYDYLADLAKYNVCAEHKTELTVATHPEEACYVLRCGKGHYPDAITKNPSLSEMHRQGTLPDGPIADNIKKKEDRKRMAEVKQGKRDDTWLIPRTDLGTGELIGPDLLTAIVDYAKRYELDPLRSHVVIMYSKPYVTIDGYLYHANQSGTPYQLNSHPLDDAERKTYQVPEGAHAFVAEVIMDYGKRSFTGMGIVTQDEMEAKSKRDPKQLAAPVVAKYPWQLAQKRAEWQALRRAFPIGESEVKKSKKASSESKDNAA